MGGLMEMAKRVELERIVVQGDKAAQKTACYFEDDITRAHSRPVGREHIPASGPFSGVAEDKPNQNTRIEESVSHEDYGEHQVPENQFLLPQEPRQRDPPVIHLGVSHV